MGKQLYLNAFFCVGRHTSIFALNSGTHTKYIQLVSATSTLELSTETISSSQRNKLELKLS